MGTKLFPKREFNARDHALSLDQLFNMLQELHHIFDETMTKVTKAIVDAPLQSIIRATSLNIDLAFERATFHEAYQFFVKVEPWMSRDASFLGFTKELIVAAKVWCRASCFNARLADWALKHQMNIFRVWAEHAKK